MIKTENLKVGMIIKNYRELCGILGLEASAGNTKKAQLKELERFVSYEKHGNKYIILEVYDMPKQKDTNLSNGNNSKYVEPIKDILIDYLHKNRGKDGKVLLSFSKLINILGLANNTYTIGNSRKRELSDILNVELKAVYYFYNNTRSEFKGIVERALKNLQKRSVIFYCTKMMIVENTGEYLEGKPILKYREAESDELGMILDAQKCTLEYLGLEDMQSLFLAGSVKYKEFVKLVMLELPKEWQFFFNVYELIVGEKAIQIEHKHMIKRKHELNEKAIDRTNILLKTIEDSDEKKLINKLINLKEYDMTLDEQIKELYDNRKAEKENRIKYNKNKINKIKQEEQDLIVDTEVTKKLYDERDFISKNDYYSYVYKIKDRKESEEFLNSMGFEDKNYYNLDDLIMDIL